MMHSLTVPLFLCLFCNLRAFAWTSPLRRANANGRFYMQFLKSTQPSSLDEPREEENVVLGLPTPEATSKSQPQDDAQRLVVGGVPVMVDKLGPIVVSPEGKMGSIANWHELTENEKEATLKFVAKRNQQRLKALRQAQTDQEQPDQ